MTMTLTEALAASSEQMAERRAFAVMEDGRTTVVVDTPSPDVYRYRLVRDAAAVGVPVTSWPLEAVELLAHDGRWYPLYTTIDGGYSYGCVF